MSLSQALIRSAFFFLVVSYVARFANADSLAIEGNAYPIQAGEFMLIREMEDDASNYEVTGGFIEPASRILKRRYDNDEEAPGYASVEIVTFGESGEGVPNVLNAVLTEAKDIRNHSVTVPNDDWLASLLSNVEVLQCQLSGRTSPDHIFFVKKERPPFSGFAAWSSSHDGKVTCIFVDFKRLNGLPVELFATLLTEYPSAIPPSLPDGNEWKRDELVKWRDCFTSVPGERALLLARSSLLLSRKRDLLGREVSSLRLNRNRIENRELTDEERQTLCDTIARRIDAELNSIGQ